MNHRLVLSRLLPLLFLSAPVQAQRTDVVIHDGWRFQQGDVAEAGSVSFDDAGWQAVTVPHTWNHADEPLKADKGSRYLRGPGWYRRTLELPKNAPGQRTFLRFEAASLVADVHFNGALLGQHFGGFTAFCYEITDLIHAGANTLAVKVDNSHFSHVPPLSGDFTVFGGLVRPVHVIQTGSLCVSPLVHGGSGVVIRPSEVSSEQAKVVVTAHVSSKNMTPASFTLKTTILDAEGKTVAATQTDHASAGQPISQSLKILKPHLWDGVEDPYLHLVRVELIKDGMVMDSVSEPLGLRFYRFDRDKGFFLNGRPCRLHGVCRHQDVGENGWAATAKDMELDVMLMREMGVNAVRLAHYPQSSEFLNLCDRNGIMAWSEVPLVDVIGKTDDFPVNAAQQLEEMITQLGNHPSIITWGLWNELQGGNPARPVIQQLHDLAHRLDPVRPTTAASFSGSEKWCPDATKVTDLLATNTYPGWYRGTPEGMNENIEKFRAFAPAQPLAISEYGAGASVHQHQQGMTQGPPARGPWHPEEWQAIAHEAHWKAIEAHPYLWGTFIWCMFDFASAGRKEGDTVGINDKGLVTRDRKVRKDAYYYYKATWSKEPVLYVTSRRHVIRNEAETSVKIYCNAGQPTLTLNGKELPKGESDGNIHRWSKVTLKEGENTLVATARRDGLALHDQVTWTYAPDAAPPAGK